MVFTAAMQAVRTQPVNADAICVWRERFDICFPSGTMD